MHVSNGAKANVTGSRSLSYDNSALEGGFAYVRGENSTIYVNNGSMINNTKAYFGGAIFAFDKSFVNFTNASISTGEAYEGHIMLQTNCTLNMTNGFFNGNVAHDKGMITAHSNSLVYITNTEFYENEAMHDSLILYIEGADLDRVL